MNKKYRKIFRPDNIVLELQATDKTGAITELVDRLVKTGDLSPERRDEALQAVLEREQRMSTGLQHGVAVPHGKTDAVQDLVAALGRSSAGIDFECLDGQPAHIIILILSPQSMSGPHIEFLAEISRMLTQGVVRDRVLAAETAEEVLQVFEQFSKHD